MRFALVPIFIEIAFFIFKAIKKLIKVVKKNPLAGGVATGGFVDFIMNKISDVFNFAANSGLMYVVVGFVLSFELFLIKYFIFDFSFPFIDDNLANFIITAPLKIPSIMLALSFLNKIGFFDILSTIYYISIAFFIINEYRAGLKTASSTFFKQPEKVSTPKFMNNLYK
ncbi:MAG: hypothetical protein QM495_12795 [Lutibacter sp.]|uniref:hypothetical protein n=1 Tax=Lutibacter sp. TaxID=1925666 RepID=UPI00385AC7D7